MGKAKQLLFSIIPAMILLVAASPDFTTGYLSTPVGTTYVEAEDTNQVIYSGSGWATDDCYYCFGEQYRLSSQANDTASLTFEGTSISVVFARDYQSGIADISIDGQPYPSVDLMNNAAGANADSAEHVIATDLTPGQHIIEVKVTGERGFEFSWGQDVRVGIDGFRYGDFPFGTVEGRVLDSDGDGIHNARVDIAFGSNVYTIKTGRDGVFNLSGLQNGIYSLTAYKPNFISQTETNILVEEGEVTSLDMILPEGDGHALFHKIYYPRPNSPVIRQLGDTFKINVKEESSATDWVVSLSTSYNSYDISVVDAVYDPITSWTLIAKIPALMDEIPVELYDLTVSSTLSSDTQVRAVKIVDQYDSTFYYVIMGDPQAATNEPGQPTLSQIVDEINLINPTLVLIVGDLLENNTASEYESFLQAINRLEVPSYSIPGNHDVGSTGTIKAYELWKEYIGRRYYSFDYGNYHFLGMDNSMLHTMDPDVIDFGNYFSDQVAWAQADLAAHQDSVLRFLFLHVTTNAGYSGDSLPEWKPTWMDDLNTNMVLSGHAWNDRVAVEGATPVHWVETGDVIQGLYRLVRIDDGVVGSYTYSDTPVDSIPYNLLHLTFSPANDGTHDTVTATIDNQLKEHFEHALIRFIMPKGSLYETNKGTITQTVDSDDGLVTIVYVTLDIPANAITTVTVGEGNRTPSVSINSPVPGGNYVSGDAISFNGTASDPEDGDLTANLLWSSDLDGPIGSGGSFTLSTLSLGTHMITATVTDSEGDISSDQISITVSVPTLPNDDFDSATLIETLPFSDMLDTSTATIASDDPPLPDCDLAPGGATVWYQFTPTSKGYLKADTEGSNYDTILGVWTGNRGDLTLVACDDDGGTGLLSSLGTLVGANETYYIEVSQYAESLSGAEGQGDGKINNVLTAQSGGSLKLNVDFSAVQTDTFLSIGEHDGWIRERTETSGTGKKVNSIGEFFLIGDNIKDKQYRAILSFDTSSLPDDAVITSATIKIKRKAVVGTNPLWTHKKLFVAIKADYFGSSLLLEPVDFQSTPSQKKIGIFRKKATARWYTAVLSDNSYPYFNVTGYTQFRLRFQKADNDDQSTDVLKIYSGDAVVEERPVLIVEYYVP
jgi:hypothetical protein